MDRQFLGPTNYPPSLLLRGCNPVPLSPSPYFQPFPVQLKTPVTVKEMEEGADAFNTTSVPLACGAVLGLQEKQPVKVYHVCWPEQKFTAQLDNVRLLSSVVTICEEEKQRFQVCIRRIYEVMSPKLANTSPYAWAVLLYISSFTLIHCSNSWVLCHRVYR